MLLNEAFADFIKRGREDLGIVLAVFAAGAVLQAEPGVVGVAFTTVGSDHPVQLCYAPPNGDVTLTTGLPTNVPGYQWYFNGRPMDSKTNPASLQLSNLQPHQAGYYVLREPGGEFHSPFALSVLDLPTAHIDTTFTADVDSRGWIIGSDQSGAIYMMLPTLNSAGTTYSDQPRRIRPDGTIDQSYIFPESAGYILTVLPDGSVITSQSPYRLTPNGKPDPITLPSSLHHDSPLRLAAQDAAGRVVLGQRVTIETPSTTTMETSSSEQHWLLARINADGSEDTSFHFEPIHRGAISQLVASVSGGYLLGYYTYDVVASPARTRIIARLGDDGSLLSKLITVNSENVRWLSFAERHDGAIVVERDYKYSKSLQTHQSNGEIEDPAKSLHLNLGVGWRLMPDGALVHTNDNLPGFVRRSSTTFEADPSFFINNSHDQPPSPGLVTGFMPVGEHYLVVVGRFADWAGHPTRGLARIDLNRAHYDTPPPGGSIRRTQNGDIRDHGSLQGGDVVELAAAIESTGFMSFDWIPIFAQNLPSNPTLPRMVYVSFAAEHLGQVGLRIGNELGVAAVAPVRFELTEQVRLANLSGRIWTEPSLEKSILGFSLETRWPELTAPVLLRAVGPTLRRFGVSEFLPDPNLALFDSAANLIGTNDDWRALPPDFDPAFKVGAFPLESGSKDASLTVVLGRGTATVHLGDGPQDDRGIALLEIYEIENGFNDDGYAENRLTNLSLRSFTGQGEQVLIGGLAIQDPHGFGRSARVLIRAIGPSLSNHGVANPLKNPLLNVFSATGELIANNDRWGDAPEVEAIRIKSREVGAFELAPDSNDAAILLSLPDGSYTLHVEGVDGESGTALLEVYLIDE